MDQTVFKPFHHVKLNAHRGLGIDIDSTLIHGPCSLTLQHWVQAYHEELDLHLITFRYGRDFELIAEDIGKYGMRLDMFKGVHGVDRALAQPYWDLVNSTVAEVGSPKFMRHLAYKKVSLEEFDAIHKAVAVWKGQKCAELGLTALVDDLEDMVMHGCTLHNVEWVNALDL